MTPVKVKERQQALVKQASKGQKSYSKARYLRTWALQGQTTPEDGFLISN